MGKGVLKIFSKFRGEHPCHSHILLDLIWKQKISSKNVGNIENNRNRNITKKNEKIEKEFTQAKLSRNIFGILSRNGQIPYGSMDIRCRKLTNSALFSVPLQSN